VLLSVLLLLHRAQGFLSLSFLVETLLMGMHAKPNELDHPVQHLTPLPLLLLLLLRAQGFLSLVFLVETLLIGMHAKPNELDQLVKHLTPSAAATAAADTSAAAAAAAACAGLPVAVVPGGNTSDGHARKTQRAGPAGAHAADVDHDRVHRRQRCRDCCAAQPAAGPAASHAGVLPGHLVLARWGDHV
jgi:hypothetical protein